MTTPCRSITIPISAGGLALAWTSVVLLRGFAVGEAGEGWISAFSLQLAAQMLTGVAIVWTVAHLLQENRRKYRQMIAEHRDLVIERVDELVVRRIADCQAAIIEAGGLQLLMKETLDDEAPNVARFPTPRG